VDALGVEGFLSMVDLFDRDLAPRLLEIDAAIAAGNLAAAAKTAHYLRGAAANLGFIRLATMFATLETAAKGNAVVPAGLLASLERIASKTVIAAKRIRVT
jgi:HPt (histidine-containing phosphotransfer) domain-containing protein